MTGSLLNFGENSVVDERNLLEKWGHPQWNDGIVEKRGLKAQGTGSLFLFLINHHSSIALFHYSMESPLIPI